MDIISDESVQPFDYLTPLGRSKAFISDAAICSTKLNFAIGVSQRQGFTPIADAAYQHLLGTKYARAAITLQNADPEVKISDLSFAIFDELVPTELIDALTFGDVIKYRRESEGARDAFLEQLAQIHAKQSGIDEGGDYAAAVNAIIVRDVLPAARDFKNRIDKIYENLFGSIAARAIAYASGGSTLLTLFGHLSWASLVQIAGLAGGAALQEAIKAELAARAARRECAISYLINLEK